MTDQAARARQGGWPYIGSVPYQATTTKDTWPLNTGTGFDDSILFDQDVLAPR